jgi:hypothetical protein
VTERLPVVSGAQLIGALEKVGWEVVRQLGASLEQVFGCRLVAAVACLPERLGNVLGTTTAQLQAQLTSGTTLAAAATAAGKSLDTFAQSLTSAAKSTLDAAVAGGSVTQGVAQAVLVGVPQQVAGLLTTTLGGRCGLVQLDLSTAASLLGLTTADLRVQLAAGKTLADLASAADKTLAGVATAATDAVKTAAGARSRPAR